MLDYKKQRQLIICCVLAIILVVIISIIYIISIWIPEPEEEKVFEVGSVDGVEMNEEDVLIKYYKVISNMLMESRVDDLIALVGEDYLEYYNYTLDDIRTYLQSKNILNKNLELANSLLYSVTGFNNVYHLELKAVGEIYSLNVIVREISPENYTIAFDKFIDYNEHVYSGVTNSVELRVLKRARFINSVEYRVRITNNYDKAITLNTNKETAGLTLASKSQGTGKKPILLGFANQTVNIEAGYSREFDATYSIDSDTDYLLYNVLVLKDVTYSEMNGTNNLEFYMN